MKFFTSRFPLNRFLVFSLLAYIILFGGYVLTSNGLGATPFYLQMRRFIPVALLMGLTSSLLSLRVKLSFWPTFIATSLAWMFTYTTAYKITYASSVNFFSHHFDFVFAGYSFAGLTALAFLLRSFLGSTFAVVIISLLQFLLLYPIIVQLVYFMLYGTCISEAAIMAIYQTTPAEAWEYLQINGGIMAIGVQLLGLVFLFFLLFKLNHKGLENINTQQGSKLCLSFLSLVAIGITVYSFVVPLPKAGLPQAIIDVHNYFSALKKYDAQHNKIYQELQLQPSSKHFSAPSTIIMVIGESASRHYMSSFRPFKLNTTPWLAEHKNDPDFVLFPHSYTSWGQTVPALERALTNKDQYDEKDFNSSTSIIDIAKKAGYKTYWFSNQTTIDIADTPITLVGKTADVAKWTNQDIKVKKYDGVLLNYLKEVDPHENNFIVLHFMGSHEDTQNRYPQEFSKFGPGSNPEMSYYNSLYYTDQVLKQVHEYACANLNLQVMYYFSDHGGVPNHRRHPDQYTMAHNRVPAYLYLSKEYQALYPDITQTLKAHQKAYFTNDLSFELICGLLDVKTSVYDETKGLASPSYRFTRDSLTTNLGKTKLTEDKDEYMP